MRGGVAEGEGADRRAIVGNKSRGTLHHSPFPGEPQLHPTKLSLQSVRGFSGRFCILLCEEFPLIRNLDGPQRGQVEAANRFVVTDVAHSSTVEKARLRCAFSVPKIASILRSPQRGGIGERI